MTDLLTTNIFKLKRRTIDTIRDVAIQLEKEDLETAQELMLIAYLSRPNGPLIKSKLDRYSEALSAKAELKRMLDSGELAIVPVGFRCHTKNKLFEALDFSQKSLPFDNGFFRDCTEFCVSGLRS